MTSFGALKEGIVYRQGGLGLWKKRIFILQDEVIYLFSNEKRMEAASSILVTSITSVTELPFEETKREFSFRIEHLERVSKDKDKEKEKDKDKDGDGEFNAAPQKAIVLACASRAELDSWCESLETVRTYDSQRREHELAYEEGGEWGRVRALARETLRASKGVFTKTVILTGMLKNLRFGPSGTGSISSGSSSGFFSSSSGGSMSAADAEKAHNSVNLEFFNAAIGEMSILLAKDVVIFLASPFDGARFQSVSESAKQMINLLATLPKLARGTSNESAVQFHANALQQELQRLRKTRLLRPSDEIDFILSQLEIEMEKLVDAGENEERLHSSKLLNSCAHQFITSCKWIVDVLDSKEDGDLIVQTAMDLGPAIDEYRKQVKNAFYFRQGTSLVEERQEIFGILTYCSQLIQDSKRTGASVDRFVSKTTKIRETMLLTAPPTFMQCYEDNADEDGSDESIGSRSSTGSLSSLSSSATSLPRSIPSRLQIETMFSSSPPTSRSNSLSQSLSHSRSNSLTTSNSNLTFSSTPPVASPPQVSFLTQSLSPPLSSSLPDSPSFLGSLSRKASAAFSRSHSGSSPSTFSEKKVQIDENIEEVDPFGGDTPPSTYSPGKFINLRTERSSSYNIPNSNPRVSLSSPRERSVSYNNVDTEQTITAPLSPSALSQPSTSFPLSGLTVEQENAWDALIADAEKFVLRQKKAQRSLKFNTVSHRGSPTLPTSPLRNSSSSLEFSPLVHEIGEWDSSGEEKLPPSLTTATSPPAPTPAPSSHAFFSISAPAAAFLAARQARKQAKKAQIAEKKKLIPAANSGANLVLEPKIPSFLTQPAAPSPTPISTASSPPPSPSPISPRCISPPPVTYSPTTPSSPIPPSPLSPGRVAPLSPTPSSPIIPSPLSPGRVVPLSPSPNFPADSLPPFKLLDLPTIPLPVIDVSSLGIRPDEEGEKQNKRQGIPDELAEIFEKQEQQLLEQQKQILKQQQEFILQQFEEQRKALATIQRQALEAHKFVSTPVAEAAPRAFVTARPKAITAPPTAFLSTPTSPTSTPPPIATPTSPTSTTPPPTSPIAITPPIPIDSTPTNASFEPQSIASSSIPDPMLSVSLPTDITEKDQFDEPNYPRAPSTAISSAPSVEDPLSSDEFPFSSSAPRPPSMLPQNNIASTISFFSSSAPRPPSIQPSSSAVSMPQPIPRPPSDIYSSSPNPLTRSVSNPIVPSATPRPPSILPSAFSSSPFSSEESPKKVAPMQRTLSATQQAHLLSKNKSSSLSSSSPSLTANNTPRPPSFANPSISPTLSRTISPTPRPPSFANPPLSPVSSSSPSLSPSLSPKTHRTTPPEAIPMARSASATSINNNFSSSSQLSSSPLSPPPKRKPPGPPTRELSSPSLSSFSSSPSPSSPNISRAKRMPHPPSGVPVALATFMKQQDRKNMPRIPSQPPQ